MPGAIPRGGRAVSDGAHRTDTTIDHRPRALRAQLPPHFVPVEARRTQRFDRVQLADEVQPYPSDEPRR
jgi:hypothetical protein